VNAKIIYWCCSIHKMCDGLEINIREFFDSPLFEGLEQEVK
jgi:hypothetical protein